MFSKGSCLVTADLKSLPVAGVPDALEQSLDPAQTEWERSRERDEFTRASILYRPSSSSLSSRFTRGQHGEDEQRVERSQDQEVGHPGPGPGPPLACAVLPAAFERERKRINTELKSEWFLFVCSSG